MSILLNIQQDEDVINFLSEYAQNPRGFVLLSGKNGTGKSYAAMQVYNCISPFKLPAYDNEIAIFLNQADLNMKWSLEISKWSQTISLLTELKNTRLLVIDDLGTRTPTDAFMDFLYALVDARYEERRKKGTIITTNLTGKDMREKFGDAFVSRAASGQCFRLEGEDRRFNGRKTAQDALESQNKVIGISR